MKVKLHTTTKQKTVFVCLQADMLMIFFLAISIDELGQNMPQVQYHIILRYCLVVPLFLIDEVCHVFSKVCLYIIGEHTIYCKELPDFNA